jgi:DNA replication protein DnaC
MKLIKQAIPDVLSSAMTTPKLVNRTDWRPKFDAYEPSLVRAQANAIDMVSEMESDSNPRWLTLVGCCGCGKTMLAQQLFIQSQKTNPGAKSVWISGNGFYSQYNRRPRCVWLTANIFADRMRSGEYDLPEYLSNDYFVVIDDIGTTRDKTDFVADGLYRLCNSRIGKWTVFTTNLSLPEISDRVDERVASRMIRDGNQVVKITAKDYALKTLVSNINP